MFWFFNSFAVLFILIGRHRSKWLWFPALLLGLYLFWVMIAWNRVPSFSDSISISASERGIKDSIGVDVLVKHPYFGFRNFSDDIWDFCFGYGQSNVGISCILNSEKKYINNDKSNDSTFLSQFGTIKKYYRNLSSDSVNITYQIKTRKEMFGHVDDRKSRKRVFKSKDDRGVKVVKRVPSYEDNTCVDSLWIMAAINAGKSVPLALGMDVTINHSILRLLRMEDISQFDYTFTIDDQNAAVKRIELDFGGPTEFNGISPTPDIIEPSRIIYNTEAAIKDVKKSKQIRLYCQNLETTNIQNIRLFLLTTLSTLCIGYTLKELGVFLIFIFGCFKSKWEKFSNRVSPSEGKKQPQNNSLTIKKKRKKR